MQRKFNRKIKRVVVKVGTSILSGTALEVDVERQNLLVTDIANLVYSGIEVVLVSSGAVLSGMSQLGVKCRPQGLACIQATASLGQVILMRRYSDLFKNKKLNCGQVLLTWDDFNNRGRYLNAKHTINALLEYKAIPIINENDTVSTEEIKFGDNDRLSALVTCMVAADLLVILSDVDGLYQIEAGKEEFIEEVIAINPEIESLAKGTGKKQISKGGMKTKLEAAKIVTRSGIDCIVANGRIKNILNKIISGECLGTHFLAQAKAIDGKKSWLAFGTQPKGKIVIDDGAKQAVLNKGKSLLFPGITGWEGSFSSGDTVIVFDMYGIELGKGIINYSRSELEKEKGKRLSREVIHRDNLVLTKKQ